MTECVRCGGQLVHEPWPRGPGLDRCATCGHCVGHRPELVAAVKAHAQTHYNDGGWDVIVECWDDEAIIRLIGNARTVNGALRKFRPVVSVWADRQADAINSAF